MGHVQSDPPGVTVLELLAVVWLITVLAAITVPLITTGVEAARVAAACRYLAGRMYLSRMEAVKRSAYVGVRFEARGTGYAYATYMDGNRNGIRTADITSGVDRRVSPPEELSDHFSGATFGILAGVGPIDPGDTLTEGGDPIRVGRSNIVSFSPDGTATAGTLYLRGPKTQHAVRILGVTGRIRTLRFNFKAGQWNDQ